jgi:hypothetical protein
VLRVMPDSEFSERPTVVVYLYSITDFRSRTSKYFLLLSWQVVAVSCSVSVVLYLSRSPVFVAEATNFSASQSEWSVPARSWAFQLLYISIYLRVGSLNFLLWTRSSTLLIPEPAIGQNIETVHPSPWPRPPSLKRLLIKQQALKTYEAVDI